MIRLDEYDPSEFTCVDELESLELEYLDPEYEMWLDEFYKDEPIAIISDEDDIPF